MLIPDCGLAYVYLGKLSKKGYLLIHNINFYIDEFKELAYKFRITTKINLNKTKSGFLNQELPVVLNLFAILLKYATC